MEEKIQQVKGQGPKHIHPHLQKFFLIFFLIFVIFLAFLSTFNFEDLSQQLSNQLIPSPTTQYIMPQNLPKEPNVTPVPTNASRTALKSGTIIKDINGFDTFISKYGYSFKFPSDVTLSQDNGPVVSLSKHGPTYSSVPVGISMKNLDGIFLTIVVESSNSSTATLLDYANSDYKAMYNGAIPNSITLAGKQGYVVTIDLPSRQIFESTIYLPLTPSGNNKLTQPGSYLEITDRTFDPTNQGYKQIVQGILNSLSFN